MKVIHRLGVSSLLALASGRDEDGQVLVEYALIIAAVAIVCITVLTTIGGHVSSLHSKVSVQFP